MVNFFFSSQDGKEGLPSFFWNGVGLMT